MKYASAPAPARIAASAKSLSQPQIAEPDRAVGRLEQQIHVRAQVGLQKQRGAPHLGPDIAPTGCGEFGGDEAA